MLGRLSPRGGAETSRFWAGFHWIFQDLSAFCRHLRLDFMMFEAVARLFGADSSVVCPEMPLGMNLQGPVA